MSLELLQQGRDVRQAFGKLRRDYKASKPDGFTPEEKALIAQDFAALTGEVAEFAGEIADLLGMGAPNKENVIQTIRSLLAPNKP